MERYTQDLSLLVKQIQLLEEQQQQQNYYNNLFSQNPNPYNKSFEEIIEYLLGTTESTFLIHHFEDFPQALSYDQQKEFQKLRHYYLRHQNALRCFNKPFSEECHALTSLWIKGMRGDSIIDLIPHLDSLRDYFHLHYQKLLDQPTVSYKDVLAFSFGPQITEFYYTLIKESKDSFLRLYNDYLESFPQTYIPVHYLHLSKEETLLVLEELITLASSVLPKQDFYINFGPNPFPSHFHNEHTTCLNLGVFTDFMTALHQCLKQLGKVFLQEYTHSFVIMQKSDFEQLHLHHSILEFCTLLPILSQTISKAIIKTIYPDKLTDDKFVNQIQEELLYHYFRTNKLNTSIESHQPLQEILKCYIEMEIEEDWFNGAFPSIELSHEWNVRSNECLHKVPSTHMDGLLRHIHWTQGELGNAFGKLLGLFSIFCSGLPKEPYDHPFSEFLEHFSSDQLRRWHPTYELIEHLRMNPESTKCCWVFFKQKLNEFK